MARKEAPTEPVPATMRTHGAGTGRDMVRTTCGRELTVSHLRLDRIAHPTARVTVSIPRRAEDHDGVWAGLTPDEARRLAALLLAHAETADGAHGPNRADGTDDPGPRRGAGHTLKPTDDTTP